MTASHIFSLLDLGKPESGKENRASSEGKDRDVEAPRRVQAPPLPGPRRRVLCLQGRILFTHSACPKVRMLDSIKPAQLCGLVGPSGAWKPTFMALVQSIAHFDGSVRFNVDLGARSTPRAQGRCRTGWSPRRAASPSSLSLAGCTQCTARTSSWSFIEAGGVAARGRHEEPMEKSESCRLRAIRQMLGH
ncbi:hypothetical protein LX32DRAFT_649262 [Colletotrichum zoysiae]|uniref:ABC transporter domain-containing protein n=1 Tax=Colletotrichum zoysiae TaxID=1216348 RepID=A0AAD9M8F4_9PEZI|nr:hypothetical protein LX32DRAFT_649262 [Colletotrichum zoysiae]